MAEFERTFPCGLCRGIVTARRILSGYIIKCDCAEVHSEVKELNPKLWRRIE